MGERICQGKLKNERREFYNNLNKPEPLCYKKPGGNIKIIILNLAVLKTEEGAVAVGILKDYFIGEGINPDGGIYLTVQFDRFNLSARVKT